ncbi:MAG TPA: CerR family C-terminal domain-containing protein [Desulfovibrio sp.]|uniref:CerR family C-terminal domain-containing protein n=1 Tax=Desulfovibrio sp. TaxID=885 RepID=UPI002B58AF86|nr:CerR family C-terminal domain-containing protein [Desulfovibrio sp.]HMM39207.1 CerR family C-terminal domain-containing protein [Desulfovibrio sp.]
MSRDSASREQTKENLLRAAIRVFGDKGFQAATVREICQAAGANVAAVNYHFGGKEALYAAVLELMFASSKHCGRDLPCPSPGAPAEERLRHLIRRSVLEIYGDLEGEDQAHCQALSSLFLMEMAHPSPDLDGVIARHVRPDTDELFSILSELLDRAPDDDLVKDAGACVMGQILFYTVAWPIVERLRPDERPEMPPLDRLAEVITRFSLAGIAGFKKNPL